MKMEEAISPGDFIDAMIRREVKRASEFDLSEPISSGGFFKMAWDGNGPVATRITAEEMYKPIPSPSEAGESS